MSGCAIGMSKVVPVWQWLDQPREAVDCHVSSWPGALAWHTTAICEPRCVSPRLWRDFYAHHNYSLFTRLKLKLKEIWNKLLYNNRTLEKARKGSKISLEVLLEGRQGAEQQNPCLRQTLIKIDENSELFRSVRGTLPRIMRNDPR